MDTFSPAISMGVRILISQAFKEEGCNQLH